MVPDLTRRFDPGTRVRHIVTGAVGTVLAVLAAPDGTWRLLVQKDCPLFAGQVNKPTEWAAYHAERSWE